MLQPNAAHAAVLTGLRLLQRELIAESCLADELMDILSCAGTIDPVATADDIDDLCERLNFGDAGVLLDGTNPGRGAAIAGFIEKWRTPIEEDSPIDGSEAVDELVELWHQLTANLEEPEQP